MTATAQTAVETGEHDRARRLLSEAEDLSRAITDPSCTLPTHWPWSKAWITLWGNTIGFSPPLPATP